MHIDVADPVQMGEYRHAGFVLYTADQAFAATRHNHIEIAVQTGQHHADGSAVRRVDNLHAIFIQTGGLQRAGKAAMDEPGRILNFR